MRAVVVAACLVALEGCHAGTPSTGPSPASVKAPVLRSLPAQGTIAWVRPATLIADATTEDDVSATLGGARSMRLDVEAVLKGERWSVVNEDSAQLWATIAIVARTRIEQQQRVGRSKEPAPRQKCDATRTAVCSPEPQPVYETVGVTITDTKVVFVVQRRSDGARFEYSSGYLDAKTSGGACAKQVIMLMRAR